MGWLETEPAEDTQGELWLDSVKRWRRGIVSSCGPSYNSLHNPMKGNRFLI